MEFRVCWLQFQLYAYHPVVLTGNKEALKHRQTQLEYILYSRHLSNTDKRQYVYASTPAPPNNIRPDVLNHGTNTRTETEHGQNSYLQNIKKAVQDIHFQKLCIAYMTPDTNAQHTNPPKIIKDFS
jgi:GTPase SAR1 family protein